MEAVSMFKARKGLVQKTPSPYRILPFITARALISAYNF